MQKHPSPYSKYQGHTLAQRCYTSQEGALGKKPFSPEARCDNYYPPQGTYLVPTSQCETRAFLIKKLELPAQEQLTVQSKEEFVPSTKPKTRSPKSQSVKK